MFFFNWHTESSLHLFVHCPSIKLLWDFIQNCFGVKGKTGSLKAWWTEWRKKRVKDSIQMIWDMYMMALILVVWTERNNRIFNHKACSIINLLDSIISFDVFLAGNLRMPSKRKVDTSVLTYARKRLRVAGYDNSGVADGSALVPFIPAADGDAHDSATDRNATGQLVLFDGGAGSISDSVQLCSWVLYDR